MSARTLLTLANGRHVDLRQPRAGDVDFAAYAEHLAKEARFNGATPGVFYSVAQHACLAADAALGETGDRLLAAAVLIHDHAEAVSKDDTTPKKMAIAETAQDEFGVLAPVVLDAFDKMIERHEFAIHAAAGIDWPLPAIVAGRVKHYDLKLFVTEWRDLMSARGIAHPEWQRYAHIDPLPERIVPWPWEVARNGLMRRCRALLPALQEKAS